MNMDNPFEAQSGRSYWDWENPSQNVVLGKTICEEKMIEQSLTPEHLSRSFRPPVPQLTRGCLIKNWNIYGGWRAAGKSYEVYLGKISRNPIVRAKFPAVFCSPSRSSLSWPRKGLVGVGRALLADAGWARKIREGRFSELTGFTKEALATLA